MLHQSWGTRYRRVPPAEAMTQDHEERLRRAVRHLVQAARSDDRRADVERVFDLIAFLPPDAQAVVEDETACTLSELYGSI